MHRHGITKRLAVAAIGLAVALPLAGCGSSGDGGTASASTAANGDLVIDGEVIASADMLAKAKTEGTVTIYSAYSTDKEQVIVDAFTKATGVKAQIVQLSTSALVTRLETESKAGQHTADIVKLGNSANMDSLGKAKILAAYTPPAAYQVPATASHENGLYWDFTESTVNPAWNTAKVGDDDAPTSWADLMDPKWKGKIGLPAFSAGAQAVSLYQMLTDKVSPDAWSKLAAEKPSIESMVTAVGNGIVSGTYDVGPAIPSLLKQAIEGGAQVKFLAEPKEGLPLAAISVATVADAPHAEAAQLYMNFLLAKAGQELIPEKVGDYAVREDVAPPVIGGTKLPALNSGYQFYSVEPDQLIANNATWTQQWNKAFNYTP